MKWSSVDKSQLKHGVKSLPPKAINILISYHKMSECECVSPLPSFSQFDMWVFSRCLEAQIISSAPSIFSLETHLHISVKMKKTKIHIFLFGVVYTWSLVLSINTSHFSFGYNSFQHTWTSITLCCNETTLLFKKTATCFLLQTSNLDLWPLASQRGGFLNI